MDGLNRREKEDLLKQKGRVPPGQALTEKFPVLHYGPVPPFNEDDWTFRVWGAVEQERQWTWQEFQELPRRTVTMDIHCVTRWSKFDTQWEGVSVKDLIDHGYVKLLPGAGHILQHCEYNFTVNVPLSVALADNFLLATHFDGRPLTPDHGYPLRGVVGHIPERDDLKTPYFWKGGKWLRGLEFLTEDKLGFWEQAGYHNEADVWKEQRLASNW